MGNVKVIKDSAPIILGYIPIAIAFGAIAKEYLGLNALLMSMLVFAGASQFIALQLLIKGSSAAMIVLTTFIVNLRHILMSSYLSKFIKTNAFKKAIIAFGITDETFAIGSKNPNSSYQLKLNFIAYFSWIFGTALGLAFGYLIPKSLIDILPFALITLFIFILVDGIKCNRDILVAIVAGVFSVLLSFMRGWNVLIAALIACFVGYIMEVSKGE